ncbi:scabin-related ADP-ribosyltransferase [Streptosporangium saharense]|uniref:scabin-related ADP-ribosyltransferase n=1 Tax=Streptosporangium saharense TaxID=1706840 RepID=UPI00332E5992
MALQPPAELAAVLNLVTPWPVIDEDKLHASGQRWITFATTMSRNASVADAHVAHATVRNEGDDIRALGHDWRDTSDRSGDAIAAALFIGYAQQISAMAVLAMKVSLIAVLVRLALNLRRLATASGPTGGVSLTAIPAVVGNARQAVRQIIRKVVELLRRSALRLFERASKLLRKPAERAGAGPPPPPRSPKGPQRPPTPPRGPDNYLEAAADRSVDVKTITPYPIWRRDREPLYRADNRSPDEVFEQGFHPRDPSATDLDAYVHRGASSAFVGTSTRRDIANVLPRRYTYEVDAPGGIDTNRTFATGSARLHHEQEIAFPGGVHRRYVSGAWPEGVPKTPEHFIPNPHFDPYPGYPQA